MKRRAIPLAAMVALGGFLGAAGCGGGSSVGSAPEATEPDPSLGMEFVRIPAGQYLMGDRLDEGLDDEFPLHQVTVAEPYFLGKYEVTQAQWRHWMGTNPSFTQCDACPVDTVSWDDVQEFIGKLNAARTGGRYRLPTEAEWEHAARAGNLDLRWAGTSNEEELSDYAWTGENSGNPDAGIDARPQPVGQKLPNAWGLHDMSGNVGEWVQDWYGTYPPGPVIDPTGPLQGDRKVIRGGNACDRAFVSRVPARDAHTPDDRMDWVGFRLAWAPE